MHRFIARLPILDRDEKVYGYELLFRPGEKEIWPTTNGDSHREDATPGAPAFEGINEITDGARAFVKCTRQVLLGASREFTVRPRSAGAGGKPEARC